MISKDETRNTFWPDPMPSDHYSIGKPPKCGNCFEEWPCPKSQQPKKVDKVTKIPELHPEDLDTLARLIEELNNMLTDGLFEIEIRVRLEEVGPWAVIGYGEAGDPCVLRFEG